MKELCRRRSGYTKGGERFAMTSHSRNTDPRSQGVTMPGCSPANLCLLVLRSHRPEGLREFLRALGLEFVTEQRGTGPLHPATRFGGLVLEIYPDSQTEIVASAHRLGFAVASLAETITRLEVAGGVVVTSPRPTEWGLRAVLRGPDGRPVELYERDGG
jgi:lactoylglutathione lyase